MQKIETVKELYHKFIVPTYTQSPLCIVKGKGARVWDIDGKEYLDFFPGWAVSGLGHCPKRVVHAIQEQAGNVLHVSNNYMNQLQPLLAQKIIEHSFKGKVFFANSGAEANEAAIKLARRYGEGRRFEIITMNKSFHGRTLATITATGQDKVKKGFAPLPEGFISVPFNDIGAVKKALTKRTIAVMLEFVQGEGGIHIATTAYIKELRRICNEQDVLLIADEVQTGMGRTGKMFAYQHYGVKPDIMTLAKSLGGGVPIGAMVAKEEIAGMLGPGSHASTFGGSPLVCAASLAVFETIENDTLLAHVANVGKYLTQKLKAMKRQFSIIEEIRGLGLMIGVELVTDGAPIAKACFESGLLINCTQGNVLRIMPPLNVTKKEIDKGMSIFKHIMGVFNDKK